MAGGPTTIGDPTEGMKNGFTAIKFTSAHRTNTLKIHNVIDVMLNEFNT